MTRQITPVTKCGIGVMGLCFKLLRRTSGPFRLFSFGLSFHANLQILATGLLKLCADLYLFEDIQGRADAMFLPRLSKKPSPEPFFFSNSRHGLMVLDDLF